MNALDALVKAVNDSFCRAHDARKSAPLLPPMRLSELPTLSEATRLLVIRALEVEGGNACRAARRIGVGKTTFYRYMQEYGVAQRHA